MLYYCKKIILFCLSIWILSICVFTISRVAPGDPLVSYYGDRVQKMHVEERQQAIEKLGLDESIPTQYTKWFQQALQGDFGISYKYKTDVTTIIEQRIGNTVLLGGISYICIFIGSIVLGVICAIYEDTWLDKVICKVGTITSCIPEFWLALVFILVFSVNLHLLPTSGAYTIGQENNIMDRCMHLILPCSILIIEHLWYYAYIVRNKLLDEFTQDYVLLAKIKGCSRKQIVYKHCLRNILPSYLSVMAIALAHILGGTYIVEMVFSYPGIGTLAYESAQYKDYNLLMLLSLMTGILVIFSNTIAQIINEKIDPRFQEDTHERRI